MELARRSFLVGSFASLFAAPAIVRASSLMPIKAFIHYGTEEVIDRLEIRYGCGDIRPEWLVVGGLHATPA